MKCVTCKSDATADAATTITIERHGTVLVLCGVPARVCQTWGEAYVTSEVTDEILRHADPMHREGVERAIRRFAVA